MAGKIQTQLDLKKDNGKQTLNQMMSAVLDSENYRKRFDELLGKRAPQFISGLITMVNASNDLQTAFYEAPQTVIQAALKAATYDLPIDPALGYAYIVPFNTSFKDENGNWQKKMMASFIPGWKGYHQMALRTAMYKAINVVDVRQGELISYNRLTEEVDVEFVDDDAQREQLPVIGYLGYYRLINGFEKTIYRTVAQINAHEKRFRKGDAMTKLARDDFDAYARKTVYRELIGKWGIMSIDYRSQQYADLSSLSRDDDAADHIEVTPDDVVILDKNGQVVEGEKENV